jgi:hypothetical protein
LINKSTSLLSIDILSSCPQQIPILDRPDVPPDLRHLVAGIDDDAESGGLRMFLEK